MLRGLLLLPKPDMEEEEARRLMEAPITRARLRNRGMCTSTVPLALPTRLCRLPRMSSPAHTGAAGDRYRSRGIHLNRDMKVTTFTREEVEAITKSLMPKVVGT
jgi:hypothetical protein